MQFKNRKNLFFSSLILIISTIFILLNTLPATNAEEFNFAAMCDSRGIYNGVNKPVLEALISHMLKENKNAKFVLFPGDMINGDTRDPNSIRRQFEEWKKIMSPIYDNRQMLWPCIWTLPGNHEIQHKDAENIYREMFPDVYMNGPENEKGLSYYFIYKNSLFIGIDTNRWNYDANREGWRYIEHLDWLENVLNNAQKGKVEHIFVFGHEPAFPTGGHLRDSLSNLGSLKTAHYEKYLKQRDLFWNLLVKYKVDAYICGHEHNYSRQSIGGVFQIITGSAGAPLYYFNARYGYNPSPKPRLQELTYNEAIPYYKILKYAHGPRDNCQASPDFVGKHAFHYIVFHVNGNKVTVKTWGEEQVKPTSLTIKNENIKLIDQFIISH